MDLFYIPIMVKTCNHRLIYTVTNFNCQTWENVVAAVGIEPTTLAL